MHGACLLQMVEEMKNKHRAEVQALQQERDALVMQMQDAMQHHAKASAAAAAAAVGWY